MARGAAHVGIPPLAWGSNRPGTVDFVRSNDDHLGIDAADDLHRAAAYVLSQNVVHGDALTMRTTGDEPIVFAEWGTWASASAATSAST